MCVENVVMRFAVLITKQVKLVQPYMPLNAHCLSLTLAAVAT